MPDRISFDAYLGWVNITNPNQIPADARVIEANDLLRYENFGKKAAEVINEMGSLASDEGLASLILSGGSTKTGEAFRSTIGLAVSQMEATATTPTAKINEWLAAQSPLKVKRLVGEVVLTAPLVVQSDTYLDLTGTTIRHGNGIPGMNMIQNAAVTATAKRDKNITVIGGLWDRGTNGGSGTNLHSARFRRVDGLRIAFQTWKTAAGKYCVNVGDLTDFEIDHLEFLSTFSDGVHIQGPASGGHGHPRCGYW